jgi:hypothetical protein
MNFLWTLFRKMGLTSALVVSGLFFSYGARAQGTAASPQMRQDYRAMMLEMQEVFSDLKDQFKFFESGKDWSEQVLAKLQVLPNSTEATAAGRPLSFVVFGDDAPNVKTILWVGGIHPDEFVPTLITWLNLRSLIEQRWSPPAGTRVVYVPYLNPDGMIDGHRRSGYPTRTNGQDVDLNRSLYDRATFGPGHSENEIEFLLDLLERFRPEQVVIPHSSLMLLDIDGHQNAQTTRWLQEIHRLSGLNGGVPIPINDHPVYGPPNERDQWSVGRWITEKSKSGVPMYGLTFEFGGPTPHPGANDPNRGHKLSLRKHLGRYSANTHWAHTYFAQYQAALLAGLLLPQ